MISHKHKCIFIHISKCAGTTVEKAFGIEPSTHRQADRVALFGWDDELKLHLQHATPQQLLDLNLVTTEQWDTYYKFVIYRNTWSKMLSNYFWTKRSYKKEDTFENYLNKSGKFAKILNDSQHHLYCGNHLMAQKEYFFLNGERIDYDREVDFDTLPESFNDIIDDLDLVNDFFIKKENINTNQKSHYSLYYSKRNKKTVDKLYEEDIKFFNFKYEYHNKGLKFYNKAAIK